MAKRVLLLEAERRGYDVFQAEDYSRSMTVGELRDFLEDYNDDTKIYISNDRGYTYGSIAWDSFREELVEEESEDEDDD